VSLVELEPGDEQALALLALAAGSRLAALRAADGARLVGLEEEGRLAGAAALDGSTVRAIAVDPELRGRGVGRRLLDAVPDALTAEADEAAVGFFRRCGFAVESAGGTPYKRRYVCTRTA
jgi:GNAT superfamily N-acetyltransferase